MVASIRLMKSVASAHPAQVLRIYNTTHTVSRMGLTLLYLSERRGGGINQVLYLSSCAHPLQSSPVYIYVGAN
jgi:hypothetical protein